jgi:hypothetical protein
MICCQWTGCKKPAERRVSLGKVSRWWCREHAEEYERGFKDDLPLTVDRRLVMDSNFKRKRSWRSWQKVHPR